MKTRLIAAASLLCWGCGAAAAADSNEDLLKEIDAGIAAEKKDTATRATGPLADFARGAEWRLTLRSMNHTIRATDRLGMDNRQFYVDGRLDAKSKAKFEHGILGVAAWAEYGNQTDTYRGATPFFLDRDRRRHYFELNELYYTHTMGALDLTAGRKLFKMGLGSSISPADRISAKDFNDPLNPKAYGAWQLAADAYVDATTITVAAFPWFQPSKFSSPSSRWSGTGDNSQSALYGSFQFRGVEATSGLLDAREEYPGFGWSDLQALARVKTTFSGWDFYLATFHGTGFYPVLRRDDDVNALTGAVTRTTFVREHPRVGNHSFGFSTTSGKFEFHGEGLYQYAYGKKDDHYFAYTGGTTWTIDDWASHVGLERIDWGLDYSGEEELTHQRRAGYIQSSEKARPARNNLVTRLLFKYSESLRLAYAINLDFLEGGKMNFAAIEYKIRDGLFARLHAELFAGTRETYYGQWRENDRFVVTLEYSR